MSATNNADATYVLGRSERETRRLIRQAEFQRTSTQRIFMDAGLSSGMKVLEVGSGAGDVAMLAAEIVGPHGMVVGVEANPTILETARARAAGLTNITFLNGDLRQVPLDNDFDAVVGRFVLQYLGDPAAGLRAMATHLKPGGIVAFHEVDYTVGPAALPPSPIQQQIMRWLLGVQARGGVELAMGLKLYRTFVDAGLTEPQMRIEAAIGGGADTPIYGLVVGVLRSLLPSVLQYGIATADEVDIDTLEERWRAEVISQRGVVMGMTFVGAWACKP